MFLEIITPDKTIFQGEVETATFPGVDGFFQLLNNHAPMISALGKGDIRYKLEKKKEVHFLVDGGVVEVVNNQVNVLVEKVLSEQSSE